MFPLDFFVSSRFLCKAFVGACKRVFLPSECQGTQAESAPDVFSRSHSDAFERECIQARIPANCVPRQKLKILWMFSLDLFRACLQARMPVQTFSVTNTDEPASLLFANPQSFLPGQYLLQRICGAPGRQE